MRDLRGRPERVLITGGIHHHAARLHEGRYQSLLDIAPAQHDRRVGERLLGRTPCPRRGRVEDPGVRLVRTLVLVHQRGTVGQGLLHVQHHRQRLVLDLDGGERVHRAGPVAGHHHGDRLADVAYLVGGERRVVGVDDVRGHWPGARQAHRGQVARGERGHHARLPQCRSGVHIDQTGVRHRAAQDRQVQHAGQRDVLRPHRPASDQPGVLLPLARRPDFGGGPLLGHGHAPPPIGTDCGCAAAGRMTAAASRTARTMFW